MPGFVSLHDKQIPSGYTTHQTVSCKKKEAVSHKLQQQLGRKSSPLAKDKTLKKYVTRIYRQPESWE